MPPATTRRRIPNTSQLDNASNVHDNSKCKMGTEYVEQYKKKEDEDYLKLMNNMIFNKCDVVDNMSEVTAATEDKVFQTNTDHIYQTYNFAYRPKINLPILEVKDKIVSMIASNSVVVIRGSTGCGKTTQVPQFILDAEFQKKQHCNIIVTQPRRIAALSIAKRVSHEREWPVGTLVGYQIGLIKNTCADTRITYCTTGVLLQLLVSKKHMLDYTHVILDEVHERDEDLDFLLLIVKRLLRTNSPTVKVVLMSATIDVDKFAEYFSTPMENKLLPAPVIDIPRSNPYNISIYYIDEMENLGTIPDVTPEPRLTKTMCEFCIRVLHVFDSIDKPSTEIDNVDKDERPAVLIFLPGIYEIEDLRSTMQSEKHADAKWDIIILHSLISTEDQEKIFKKPPKGFRRIILSTNIAESSITVPNAKYVIDFCMTKLLVVNSETNYQHLELCWASKSNCQQRAGRAGRVMDSRVYRMVPKAFYEKVLRDDVVPELLRAPLAKVVLKTKMLNMGEPKAILALSLDPPNLSNLRNTILVLKEIGALFNRNENPREFDGELTPLGHIMASLPLDIHMSKLIVLGHLFGVLQDAIIIAASMSVREIFNIGFYESESIYQQKLYWAANSDSDSIACLNAFKVWRNEKASRRINSHQQEKEWSRRKNLRVKSLREIDVLIREITYKLNHFGIRENIDANKHTWESLQVTRTFVLKVVIAGAFYPNYFVKFPHNPEQRKKDVEKVLCLRNPMNTIILRGWPVNQPGSLYARKFQEIFGRHLNIKNYKEHLTVSFDQSSRVYIEYENKNSPPDDSFFVRSCIKMRQCGVPIVIDLMNETEAIHRVKELGLEKNDGNIYCQVPPSPGEPPERRYMYDKKPYPELPDHRDYRTKLYLQGPFSPVEMQLIHPVTGSSQAIIIDNMSVNSVLLETSVGKRGGLLVAQIINQSPETKRLTLRNTTLLPDTPGLASLIALIFTPYMELRRNVLGTSYAGAYCGLGYNYSTGESIFKEHDLEVLFDVEITMDDLRMINKLRHWINVAMNFEYGSMNEHDENTANLIVNCQNQIKGAFKEVIYKTRKPQESVLISNFDKWNLYDESLFLEPARETSAKSKVYGLHKALELNEENKELEEIVNHVLELEILAHSDPYEMSIKAVYCKLCLTEVSGIINLRIHLCSKEHQTKMQMIDTVGDFGEDLQNIIAKMRL
ncbi:probable ATP-dependent RNA helicase spindle-E isoform X2 [Ooceraea biroi]|nr:probable ATP-dependent RNA helicase spindle-E isoform X2 [Ooceraea biroi]